MLDFVETSYFLIPQFNFIYFCVLFFRWFWHFVSISILLSLYLFFYCFRFDCNQYMNLRLASLKYIIIYNTARKKIIIYSYNPPQYILLLPSRQIFAIKLLNVKMLSFWCCCCCFLFSSSLSSKSDIISEKKRMWEKECRKKRERHLAR